MALRHLKLAVRALETYLALAQDALSEADTYEGGAGLILDLVEDAEWDARKLLFQLRHPEVNGR
jgi:hypothetical protein